MQTLKDFIENYQEEYGNNFSQYNCDDWFRKLNIVGIKDLEVNTEQMGIIVSYMLAYINGTESAFVLLRENRVDKFFGINLYLENNY